MRHRFEQRLLTRLLLPVIALAPAAVFAAGAADAQQAAKPGAASAERAAAGTASGQGDAAKQAMWRKLDANGDGHVSRSEFDAYHKGAANVAAAIGQSSSSSAIRAVHEVRASDLMGRDVKGPRGENIGEVEDLLVDVGSGNIRTAILSFGGWAGVGGKLFEYPLSAFSRRDDSGDLTLNVTKQSLESASGFDRNHWPDWSASSDRPPSAQGKPTLWRVSRLIGRDVADRNGEHMGEIADLMVDRRDGKVDYAMFRYDRPWSLDNPVVALPLKSFDFADGRRDISMNVTRSDIDAQISASADSAADGPDVLVERWILVVPPLAAAPTGDATSGAGVSKNTSNTVASDATASGTQTSSSAR